MLSRTSLSAGRPIRRLIPSRSQVPSRRLAQQTTSAEEDLKPGTAIPAGPVQPPIPIVQNPQNGPSRPKSYFSDNFTNSFFRISLFALFFVVPPVSYQYYLYRKEHMEKKKARMIAEAQTRYQ